MEILCVKCGKPAEFIFEGYSYCKECYASAKRYSVALSDVLIKKFGTKEAKELIDRAHRKAEVGEE